MLKSHEKDLNVEVAFAGIDSLLKRLIVNATIVVNRILIRNYLTKEKKYSKG